MGRRFVSIRAVAVALTAAMQQNIVAANPDSNLKLANGIAPVLSLVENGVNVSLGTDGAASNNNLNLFEEMHLAALLQKLLRRDTEALPAREVLRMATMRGAKALGLADRVGSLESASRPMSS